MSFRKFPSIGQFSNVVQQVRMSADYNKTSLPKVIFSGVTKLHGSNACVALVGDEVLFQSKEKILSSTSDNAGFYAWAVQHTKVWWDIKRMFSYSDVEGDIYVYGEWCCGNIQAGVALNQIKEKKFAIFEVVVVMPDGLERIFNPQVLWHIPKALPNVFIIECIVEPILIEVDFNEPHLVQNFLLEQTLKVEEECPVGKYFGVTGVGEGLVFTGRVPGGPLLRFKTKGEKHSSVKVKTLRELTAAELASKENSKEFVEYAVTENRLNQGVEKLREAGLEVSIRSMGAFLKWVGVDVLKECEDVLVASNIERKHVMPEVNRTAKTWFINYLTSEAGLAS